VGWCRILAEHGKEAPALKRGLEVIGRNARLQSKLISDILDVSRIVSGKLHLELQETDLVTLVDDALESVRPAAEAKKIEVSCSFNSAIAPTWGDPARLQQCIWNLLSNAIKFTPEGGRVQVTLHREQDRVEITVADNGIGIRPEFLPFVFDRF